MMMLCSKKNELGVVESHAYTLIDAYDIPGHPKLVKIRNPWGFKII
jgi:hypothetical protein